MTHRHRSTLALALALVCAVATRADAYGVGPAKPLEELAKTADLVCKGTVVGSEPVADPWLEPLVGFEVREAKLRVISVIKGATKARVIRFRHYAPVTLTEGGFSYSPQSYQLAVGRTYLVFASGLEPDLVRQLSKSHTTKEDQGVILAPNAKRHRGKTITEVVWRELRGLLASKVDADVIEAIRQLDEMSGGQRIKLNDFARTAALEAIRPKILATSEPVASAAITVFGADSPYFDDRQAPYWLAGMAKGTIAGLSPLTPPTHPAADVAVKQLLAVATRTTSAKLRASAVRALGRSRALTDAQLLAWTRDPDVGVRRAAVLVSAELSDRAPIKTAVTDSAPEVRGAAAHAIGFTQDVSLLPVLGTLLSDVAPRVRSAAALAILSFPTDQAEATLKANLATDFMPLFVNALASRDPAPYLAQLAEVIEKRLSPKHFWGGSIPAGVSWSILYAYVKARSAADLASGKLDRSLDALERMDWFSSAEPRALYALYLVRGQKVRAKRFREAARKAISYDMEGYFDMADKNPAAYVP